MLLIIIYLCRLILPTQFHSDFDRSKLGAMTSAVFFCVLFSSIFVVTKSQPNQPHSWDFRNCPSNGGYSVLSSVTDTSTGMTPVDAEIFGDLGCGPEGEIFVE